MWDELSSECGASHLGANCLQGELSLGRVVLFPISYDVVQYMILC